MPALAQVERGATGTSASDVVSGERIGLFARKQVLSELVALGWRAEVDVTQSPRDVRVGGVKATLGLRQPLVLVDGTGRVVRHVTARVDVMDADAVIQSVAVSLEVVPWSTGERIPRSGVPKPVATAPLLPQATQRTPYSRQAAPVIAIRRGEYATLRATVGAIQMESRAQALEDGWSGQAIHVRLANGTDPVLATVTSRGQLELHP